MELISAGTLEKILAEHKRKTEELLPALIKRLINSSCPDANLRIPEEDDIWAPGYDGIVSTETGSRYVAAGNSVWEFGTAADSLSKINSDYEKRTRESLGVNKAETTFYLVSSKVWAYETPIAEWEAMHSADWKRVKIYDITVICDWLNCEPDVCAWLLEAYADRAQPVKINTVQRAWEQFSRRTQPAFTHMIFTEGRSTQIEELIKCCNGKVCKVKAETQIDSYGFCLSAIMQDSRLAENVTVVGDEHTYSYLSQVCKGKKFLLSYQHYGAISDQNTTILCYGRETVSDLNSIILPPLCKSQFVQALRDMGLSDTQAEKLYYLSHGNLWPIVRRIPGCYENGNPKWLSVNDINLLRPLVLLMHYCSTSEKDRQLVAYLAGTEYPVVESKYKELLQLEDSPIKQIDDQYLIVNREEAWEALGISASDESSKRMHAKTLELISQIGTMDWVEQQNAKKRCKQLLFNYISLSENEGAQHIVNTYITELLKYFTNPASSEVLLDNLSILSEAAHEVVLKFIRAIEKEKLYEMVSAGHFLRAIEQLTRFDDTCVAACTILLKFCIERKNDNDSLAARERLLNILCLWSGHTALSIDQKRKIIVKYMKEYPDWGVPFAVEVITKDLVICESWSSEPEREITYNQKEYQDAFNEIAGIAFQFAIERKSAGLLKKLISECYNIKPEMLIRYAQMFSASDYSTAEILELNFRIREELSRIKRNINKGSSAEALIAWRESTSLKGPIESAAWTFYKYYEMPIDEVSSIGELFDEEYFSKAEQFRADQLKQMRDEYGTKETLKLLSYMEDREEWGEFLALCLDGNDYLLLAHEAISIGKENILVGLLNKGGLKLATVVFQTLPEEMQDSVIAYIRRSDIDVWLTSEKLERLFWSHYTMEQYDDRVYQKLLRYNPSGILLWLYRDIKRRMLNMKMVLEIFNALTDVEYVADFHALSLIVHEVDEQHYSDEWAQVCLRLYCNGLLKREYDSLPMCLRRYFFRKPFELIENIKNSKYRIDFHYFKLPEEAFSNSSMLFEWVKTIANSGERGKRFVGEVLGKAPMASDGIFPHEAVRDVLERADDVELTRAVASGKFTAASFRSVCDGRAEYKKALAYREQARRIEIDYPQSAEILRILAKYYEEMSRTDRVYSELGQ